MSRSKLASYLLTVVVGIAVVYPLVAILTPPDPTTQFRAAGVLLLLVFPVAYVLVYRSGFERLRALADR